MGLWTLDTCGVGFHLACQVETDDQGMAVRHIRICHLHAKLGWDHQAVEAENHGKNIAIRTAVEGKAIADPAEVAWLIDPDTRELQLSHPLISAKEAQTAIAAARALKPLPELTLKA